MRYAVLLSACLLLVGCGGPPAYLVTAVDVTEDFIDVADEALYDRIDTANDRLAEAESAATNNALEALWLADAAARAAAVALDTWEDGDQQRGLSLVSCMLFRVSELIFLLEDFGVTPPDKLLELTRYANTIFGHRCAD